MAPALSVATSTRATTDGHRKHVSDPLQALSQDVAALVEGQRVLAEKLDVLLARLAPGPRDRGDVALVGVIAASSCGLPFTAAAVWRRRDAGDLPLANALATADVESPRQLGKLLRRLGARDVGGIYFDRVGANREGTVWRARVQE